MLPEVVVVGDVCVDVVARPHGTPHRGSDTDASIRVTGGGAGGNIAAWLATLGAPVTLVARIGADAAGAAQTAELREYGVRCAFTVDPTAPTGAVVALVDGAGERTMLADRGANLGLRVADLPALPVGAARPSGAGGPSGAGEAAGGHLHLSGYTLLHAGPRDAGLAALRLAARAGLTVSVDPASAAPLAAVGAAAFLAWTAGVDLLLPNEDEAALLAGTTDPYAAAATLSRHYGAVAVTLGAGGALWAAAGEVTHVPAVPVEVVDSTGAGDAFGAGLLAAWLTGSTGADALRRGVDTAAAAVTRLGARPPRVPLVPARGAHPGV